MENLAVFGACPQIIKASVVSHVIAETLGLSEVLIQPGQHFGDNMPEVFLTSLACTSSNTSKAFTEPRLTASWLT